MTKDEALRLALEALEELTDTEQTYGALERGDTAITTIKEVLAQPEQEPKSCPTCEALARTVMLDQTSHDRHKLKWVGLTEKKVELVYEDVSGQSLRTQDYRLVLQFAVALEEKLKELNA